VIITEIQTAFLKDRINAISEEHYQSYLQWLLYSRFFHRAFFADAGLWGCLFYE